MATINGMVHIPHEWNFGTPTTRPSPATQPSPLTATPEAIFRLCDVTRLIYTYKIIGCIERATVLRANATREMREYKAGEGVP